MELYVFIIVMTFLIGRLIKQGTESTKVKLNQIIMNQEELAQELIAVKEQNDKARAEVLAKIDSLEQAVIDAGNVTPEVQTALDELKASVQTDDDIVPDATEGGETPTTE